MTKWLMACVVVLACSGELRAQSSTSCLTTGVGTPTVWTNCETTAPPRPVFLPPPDPDVYRPRQACYYAGARLVCPQ
jgi:hypothetical protein